MQKNKNAMISYTINILQEIRTVTFYCWSNFSQINILRERGGKRE